MANEYLKRTPTSTGNRSVYTWAGWLKRNKINQDYYLFSSGDDTSNIFYVSVRRDVNNNNITVLFRDGDTSSHTLVFNNNSFRDPGSWMHLVVAVDTTIVDSKSDRVKIYINGKRLTGWTTDQLANLNQNSLTSTNAQGELHTIGEYSVSSGSYADMQIFDYFLIDGQALTPDVFGFYKDGDGYQSSGTTNATDFRPGQWMPHSPTKIKKDINRRGGFGVNGFYLPMNDSSNPGADFHCAPNSIIKLKGEDLPQPRNGAPTTSDAYVSQLRTDAYAANLVLAVPGISTATGSNLITNGHFDTNTTGWTSQDATLSVDNGRIKVLTTNTNYGSALQTVTGLTVGQRYSFQVDMYYGNAALVTAISGASPSINSGWQSTNYVWRVSFTATTTSLVIDFQMASQSGVYGFWDNVILKAEDAPRDYSADINGSGTNRTPTVSGPIGVNYEIPSYYGSAITTENAGDALYYDVDGSGANAYGTGDFTFECWFYATGEPSNWGILMKHATNGSWANGITLTSKNNTTRVFTIYTHDGSSNVQTVGTTTWPIAEWHHVVAERYNGQITLYLNGVAEATRTDTRNYAVAGTPAASAQNALSIGAQNDGNYKSNGYIQDVRVYKGVAKYKGGFDVPKPYTPVGIESWRTITDTCKNNFATWNPLLGPQTTALVDGNLTVTSDGANSHKGTRSTIGVTSGKWYWEYRVGSVVTNSYVGVSNTMSADGLVGGGDYLIHGTGGNNFINPSGSVSVTNATFTTGMIIGCAFDYDAGKLDVYKDGVLAVQFTGANFKQLSYHAHISFNAAVADGWEGNFGQNPSFSGTVTAGTNADGNGKGLFKYAPPTGFLALCEDNLPTPTIADPGKHFKTVLYTGSGSSRNVTGVGFQPDFVWMKGRTGSSYNHILNDSVRGPRKTLFTNNTLQEYTDRGVSSFDNDGFSLIGGSGSDENATNLPYVAWCWKSGGAAVANTDGALTSQVSVNQDAGFSIATYTTPGTATNFGHGLGKKPAFALFKARNDTGNWAVYHQSLGTNTIRLSTSDAQDTSSDAFNSTAPTDTLMYLGTWAGTNNPNINWVSYLWAEIEGYSKFGSYVGNASADGTFVYCGFKPAFVITKRTDGTSNWLIHDSSRDPINPVMGALYANNNTAEGSAVRVDFVSNGFKHRNADGGTANNYANNYIFIAFAESPFQTANAK